MSQTLQEHTQGSPVWNKDRCMLCPLALLPCLKPRMLGTGAAAGPQAKCNLSWPPYVWTFVIELVALKRGGDTNEVFSQPHYNCISYEAGEGRALRCKDRIDIQWWAVLSSATLPKTRRLLTLLTPTPPPSEFDVPTEEAVPSHQLFGWGYTKVPLLNWRPIKQSLFI